MYYQVKTVRISARAIPEVANDMSKWAAQLGMTKTNFNSLCLQIGFRQLIRVLSPERSLDDETLERLIKAGARIPELEK